MTEESKRRPEVEKVVQAVLISPKYRHICPDLIAQIAAGELAKGQKAKQAAHQTRSKLHQIGGAFFTGRPKYSSWLPLLDETLKANDRERRLAALADILAFHASTRERFPILESFYREIFSITGEPRTILDVACGLNPLTFPWMNLGKIRYLASDIYADLIGFLNNYFELAGIDGTAEVRNLMSSPPTDCADVAFVFKALPTLEQLDKEAGPRLIEQLDARHIVITFPVRSLGGRDKGMSDNYGASFGALAAQRRWSFSRLSFGSEEVFIVNKLPKRLGALLSAEKKIINI